MKAQVLLGAWVVAMCGGCAPYQAYPGPPRAREEVAVLVQAISGIINSVDGKDLEPTLNDYVAVLPGERKLVLRARWRNGFSETVELSFTAVAGAQYWVSQIRMADWKDDIAFLGPIGAAPAFLAHLAEFSLTKRPRGGELTCRITEQSWNGKLVNSVTLRGPP